MRNYSKTVGALAAASTLVAGYASAELEGEVHVGYANMYEFRFVDLGNDLVEAGADVAWSMGDLGFSAGAWYASFDSPTVFGAAGFNNDELDLYTSASYAVGDVTFELGYIYYYFPDASADTQEVYLGASYELPFGLTFGSTFYYDFDAASGWYWDNNVGYTVEFNDCLSLELTAGVAFADGQGLQASARPGSVGTADGFQGYYVGAALPWEFRDGVTLKPYVKYTNGDSDLVTDLLGNGGQEYLIGGVSLAVSF